MCVIDQINLFILKIHLLNNNNPKKKQYNWTYSNLEEKNIAIERNLVLFFFYLKMFDVVFVFFN